MTLTPIKPNIALYPVELQPLLSGAKLYDSSCSPEASVIFIEKDSGYFLKSAPKGTLEREAAMTRYFHTKGLSANVLHYSSDAYDWLMTEKIKGDDCITEKYLAQPERLCDTLAERLALLHNTDFTDCPIPNHSAWLLAGAEQGKQKHMFDRCIANAYGFKNPEEAWAIVETHGHLLESNTLLHGDYCLPNIILDNWQFSGFIDLDTAGVGDRHVDLFWATWTLFFNLKTDKYRERFIDAYGRTQVDKDLLRVVAAIEVFG